MGFFRKLKIKTLQALRIKPSQKESSQMKISRALATIKATPQQRIEIGLIIKEMQMQSTPGDTRNLLTIALRQDLTKQLIRILGRKKSDKFFELYQDPYF